MGMPEEGEDEATHAIRRQGQLKQELGGKMKSKYNYLRRERGREREGEREGERKGERERRRERERELGRERGGRESG